MVCRPTGGFVLKAEGLATIRADRLVFAQLDFAVEAGGALLLTGPNGAGKSTLLRVLAGLGRLEAGRLTWHGDDALADRTAQARRVAYIGHLDAVKPGLTAAENLAGLGASEKVAAALAGLGLTLLANLPARMLSAGQKRRLALARLGLSMAPIWLLDEPTLGLDIGAVGLLGDMLAAHRQHGGLVIAATHLPLPLRDAGQLAMT
jgi:heme exporter protein A